VKQAAGKQIIRQASKQAGRQAGGKPQWEKRASSSPLAALTHRLIVSFLLFLLFQKLADLVAVSFLASQLLHLLLKRQPQLSAQTSHGGFLFLSGGVLLLLYHKQQAGIGTQPT
jgi:hypothetical protein